jgi:hypothetical protein
MDENEQFFIEETIAYARALSFTDSLRFLRGLLTAIGKDHPAWRKLRASVAALESSDAQLELIQKGGLRLGVDGKKDSQ